MVQILAGMVAFLVATSSPVAAQVAPERPGIPAGSPVSSPPHADTSAIAKEAQGWLADLIKINTSNPPGNEQIAAMYIMGILAKEGIKAEIIDMAPGRSAVVARLRSSAVAQPSRALLLMAHLNRDVIFLATDDEEVGGDASIRTLITKHWEKFAAGFAINEGGNVFIKNGKVQYAGVQADEKVAANIAVVARGTSGHASQPTKDNAVVHLAAAVAKIGTYSAPVRFTSIVRRYFEGLAALEDDDIGKWMRSMETSDRGEHAQRVISDASPLWNAMLRDTIAPTVLTAGVANNVIPAEARANLNVRLLPGDSISTVVNDLNKLVNDPLVRLEVQPNAGLAAPSSSLESEFYGVISKVVSREFGGAPALPFQSTWLTDSAQLRLYQVQALGLVPFQLTQDDLKRMHGDDERIPLAAFDKGVDVLAKIVTEFATAH